MGRDSDGPRPTRAEAIDAFGAVMAASDAACAQMTPREQAEAAWTPTSRLSVDELEDQVRADRGMAPLNRGGERRAARRASTAGSWRVRLPPPTDEQIEKAARILARDERKEGDETKPVDGDGT